MEKTVINKTKQANKVKNSSKLAQTKGINLLNEVIKQDAKEQKKQQQEKNKLDKLARLKQQTIERGNYNRIVNNTNKIFKRNFVSLGYLLKVVDTDKETVMQEQKQDELFNQFDEIRLNKVFDLIKLARKNSDLYKKIDSYKGIKSKKGNYSIYFLIRTINTNLIELQKLVDLQNWK